MPFYLFSFEKMYGNTQGSGNLETCHGEKQTNKPTKNQKTYVLLGLTGKAKKFLKKNKKLKRNSIVYKNLDIDMCLNYEV